jgi:tetraacyldisaccharide 4'-kinase
VFTSSYEPVSLIESRSGESVPLSSVGQASAVVFCGIGQPASFRKSAESAGIRIASFHAYGDHYRYGREDVKELAAAMNKSGADFYLTTEKDARRLDGAFDPSAPLYYLAMESCVRETEKFSALVHSLFADAPH